MENAQVSNEKKKTFHISAENSAISLRCSGIMRQFSFYGDARKNLQEKSWVKFFTFVARR